VATRLCYCSVLGTDWRLVVRTVLEVEEGSPALLLSSIVVGVEGRGEKRKLIHFALFGSFQARQRVEARASDRRNGLETYSLTRRANKDYTFYSTSHVPCQSFLTQSCRTNVPPVFGWLVALRRGFREVFKVRAIAKRDTTVRQLGLATTEGARRL
jgi:hypothetical protein